MQLHEKVLKEIRERRPELDYERPNMNSVMGPGNALQIAKALILTQNFQHDYQQYQAGIRMPRRIRKSGIAFRRLIRSKSVTAETL
jgi:hypothetical protein